VSALRLIESVQQDRQILAAHRNYNGVSFFDVGQRRRALLQPLVTQSRVQAFRSHKSVLCASFIRSIHSAECIFLVLVSGVTALEDAFCFEWMDLLSVQFRHSGLMPRYASRKS